MRAGEAAVHAQCASVHPDGVGYAAQGAELSTGGVAQTAHGEDSVGQGGGTFEAVHIVDDGLGGAFLLDVAGADDTVAAQGVGEHAVVEGDAGGRHRGGNYHVGVGGLVVEHHVVAAHEDVFLAADEEVGGVGEVPVAVFRTAPHHIGGLAHGGDVEVESAVFIGQGGFLSAQAFYLDVVDIAFNLAHGAQGIAAALEAGLAVGEVGDDLYHRCVILGAVLPVFLLDAELAGHGKMVGLAVWHHVDGHTGTEAQLQVAHGEGTGLVGAAGAEHGAILHLDTLQEAPAVALELTEAVHPHMAVL